MKSSKVLVLILFSCVLLFSCQKSPQISSVRGNFKVEFLFEQNGCKVYRFKDGLYYVYWSDCQGKTQYESSRKNAHKIESITDK